jgi:hypothetical protein
MNIFLRQQTGHDIALMNRQTLQKKIKTPPTLKKNLNFYCQRTSGTFAFGATTQANAEAKAKEPLYPTLYLNLHLTNMIR